MIVTFELTGTCAECNHEIRGIQVSTIRVNLRSIRTVGEKNLTMIYKLCANHPGASVLVTGVKLCPDDAAKVTERQKAMRAARGQHKRRAAA